MADIMDKLKARFASGNRHTVTSTLLSVDEYKEIVELVDNLEQALIKQNKIQSNDQHQPLTSAEFKG